VVRELVLRDDIANQEGRTVGPAPANHVFQRPLTRYQRFDLGSFLRAQPGLVVNCHSRRHPPLRAERSRIRLARAAPAPSTGAGLSARASRTGGPAWPSWSPANA